jgi:uncharacterized protein YbgA (DUF1722 family)/uncharacterized protein YbbK (DUF523 family)
MDEMTRPKVVVSKCLEFDHCRWNGLKISSGVVKLLKPFVDFMPVCPEMEIGLGVPREPIRIVRQEKKLRLIQSETNLDLTEKMINFSRTFLESVGEVDGFILKERSPSCGMKNVRVYPGMGKVGAISSKNPGFFGRAVGERFLGVPIEDEGRLNNFTIREHFLSVLFALARLRAVKRSDKIKNLVAFQTDHKLFLMAYSQAGMKILGNLVANREGKSFGELMEEYERQFLAAVSRPPSPGKVVNVLMHAMGYFKEEISTREKAFFLDSLTQYRDRRVPLGVPIAIIRSWIIRFGEAYLERQNFFSPYPEDLIEVTDSGKGREL